MRTAVATPKKSRDVWAGLVILGYEAVQTFVKVLDSQIGQFANLTDQADLAIEQERNSTSARAVQVPKYGQIRIEARLLRAPSLRHLRFSSCC